jgi:hypothetical protein
MPTNHSSTTTEEENMFDLARWDTSRPQLHERDRESLQLAQLKARIRELLGGNKARTAQWIVRRVELARSFGNLVPLREVMFMEIALLCCESVAFQFVAEFDALRRECAE